jgi:hypothetical protein
MWHIYFQLITNNDMSYSIISGKSRLWLGLLVLLTNLSACGHPAQRRLEGRWIGETIENIDPSFLAAATGWAKGTSFEFTGERLTVIIPAEEPRVGSYTIASVHDDRISIQAKRADGTLDSVDLRLQDEHSLQWMLPNGASLRLRKSN